MKNSFWRCFSSYIYLKGIYRHILTEVKQRTVSWVIILFIMSLIVLRPSQRNIPRLSKWHSFEICISHSVPMFEYPLKKFTVSFNVCCDIFLSCHLTGSWQLFDTSRLQNSFHHKVKTYLYITSGLEMGLGL